MPGISCVFPDAKLSCISFKRFLNASNPIFIPPAFFSFRTHVAFRSIYSIAPFEYFLDPIRHFLYQTEIFSFLSAFL